MPDSRTSTQLDAPRGSPAEPPSISAVVPMYNESENVETLVTRLLEELERLGRPFEVVLVDDGSSDGTAAAIARAEQNCSKIKGVYLARNYGQSTATQAGFDHVTGGIVVTLDADLQNDPADISRLVRILEKENVDVVCGWRKVRQDGPVRTLLSRVANRLISRLTHVRLHDSGCSLRVYHRDVLERSRLYGEMHRFLPALLAEVGAIVREVEVAHHPRIHGRTKYRLDRTVRVLLDLMLVMFFRKYLQRPLHVFGGTGLLCFIPGFLILSYLTLLKVFTDANIGARPLLTLGVLLVLVGTIFIGQGVLGELLSRTLYESGARVQYHLKPRRKLLRFEDDAAER